MNTKLSKEYLVVLWKSNAQFVHIRFISLLAIGIVNWIFHVLIRRLGVLVFRYIINISIFKAIRQEGTIYKL